METKSVKTTMRLSRSLYRKLKSDSQNAGLSMHGYITRLIETAGKDLFPQSFREVIVRQILKIGNNINQITKQANATGSISQDDINAVLDLMRSLEKVVRDIGNYEDTG